MNKVLHTFQTIGKISFNMMLLSVLECIVIVNNANRIMSKVEVAFMLLLPNLIIFAFLLCLVPFSQLKEKEFLEVLNNDE